jgi:hypothetical protein
MTSTADALRLWKSEDRKPDDKRDASRLALSVHHAHLAVEKLLKHVVGSIDPYLILEQVNSKLLLELRKEVLTQQLPSIFASRRYLASSNAEQAWALVRELVGPSVVPTTANAFESALKILVLIRNQAQHGELYGDTTEILSTLERVFARLPEVGSALCPDFLRLLEERHPHQYAELRAIEMAVDAAWWSVREQLMNGRRIAIPISVYVTIRPNVPTIGLIIDRAQVRKPSVISLPTSGESSLSVVTELEVEDAFGIFGRVISAGEADSRSEARRAVVRRRLSRSKSPPKPALTEDPPPMVGGLFADRGLSRLSFTDARSPIRVAVLSGIERDREFVEKYGSPPLEDGTISLERVSASITVPVSHRSSSHITGDVFLEDVKLSLFRRKARGTFSGKLLPRKSADSVEPIAVRGKIWLTDELVVRETASDTHPVGTVIRYLKGEVRLDRPSAGPNSLDADQRAAT